MFAMANPTPEIAPRRSRGSPRSSARAARTTRTRSTTSSTSRGLPRRARRPGDDHHARDGARCRPCARRRGRAGARRSRLRRRERLRRSRRARGRLGRGRRRRSQWCCTQGARGRGGRLSAARGVIRSAALRQVRAWLVSGGPRPAREAGPDPEDARAQILRTGRRVQSGSARDRSGVDCRRPRTRGRARADRPRAPPREPAAPLPQPGPCPSTGSLSHCGELRPGRAAAPSSLVLGALPDLGDHVRVRSPTRLSTMPQRCHAAPHAERADGDAADEQRQRSSARSGVATSDSASATSAERERSAPSVARQRDAPPSSTVRASISDPEPQRHVLRPDDVPHADHPDRPLSFDDGQMVDPVLGHQNRGRLERGRRRRPRSGPPSSTGGRAPRSNARGRRARGACRARSGSRSASVLGDERPSRRRGRSSSRRLRRACPRAPRRAGRLDMTSPTLPLPAGARAPSTAASDHGSRRRSTTPDRAPPRPARPARSGGAGRGSVPA